MSKKYINKIIYFDKETIRNILQERGSGEITRKTNISTSLQSQGMIETEASAKLKLEVPLVSRIAFLFSGKINASYIINRDNTTTMTMYCIPVGEFDRQRFDFIQEISKMEQLISNAGQPKTLAEMFPPSIPDVSAEEETVTEIR